MNIIWATRGKTWGFRFLRTGDVSNPLKVYENAFAGIEGTAEAFRKRAASVAVRFPDPDGRRDRAGRVIPHEFVILDPDAADISSAEQARVVVWQEVAAQYGAVWDQASATER